MIHRRVDRGIDQELIRDPRAAPVAGEQAGDRREVAAGAVAADGEPRRIDPERRALPGDPGGRGEAILDRGREFVLGRQAVVDRDDGAAGGIGEMAAERVVRFDIADDPAAAVEIDQHRQVRRRRGAGAAIEAQRNGAAIRPRCREVADLRDRRRLGGQHFAGGAEQPARLDGADRLIGRPPREAYHLQNRFCVGIERHRRVPVCCGFATGILKHDRRARHTPSAAMPGRRPACPLSPARRAAPLAFRTMPGSPWPDRSPTARASAGADIR